MNFVQPKWANTLVLFALSTNLLLTTFLPLQFVGIVYISRYPSPEYLLTGNKHFLPVFNR
jgi:hypothetical protein